MASYKTQRVRDPVHGLIVFEDEGDDAPRDRLAWNLLNTPEMQRLRRVRQLGVSEFTFPGATHSRFAHSLGVFHVARQLVRTLKKVLPDADWNPYRAEVATVAALLHDIGHGPFSHAFERVQKERGVKKDHEDWSAEIILAEDGSVQPLLERQRRGMAREVADLLKAKHPEDAYHAIVSSSLDADRLDYLRRDRLMTGSGAGAIDYEWLLDNLIVGDVPIGSDDDETTEVMRTFCLRRRALQAAETFLLGRYHLFEQVYLHKATRGMETIVGRLLQAIADAASKRESARIGLDERDPLVAFFASPSSTVKHYLMLDDTIVWAAASRVAAGPDDVSRATARRLLDRERLACLDMETAYPRRQSESLDDAQSRWRQQAERIDAMIKDQPGSVKDMVPFNAYGEIGEDKTRAHKRLAISVDNGPPREITSLSDAIAALKRRELIRYYFDSTDARRRIVEAIGMNARELVAGTISLADGSIIGRVKLQKIMYLLTQKGLGGPFRFSYHHYGPFSRNVDEAISDAKAFCGLKEEIKHRELDGAPFSVFKLTSSSVPEPITSLGNLPANQARKDIANMNAVTSTVIEIAATIFWLKYEELVSDWKTELTLRKSVKASTARVEQALVLLKQLGLENGSQLLNKPAPLLKLDH